MNCSYKQEGINPSKMFNIWYFKDFKEEYILKDTLTIEIPKEGILEYKYNNHVFQIKEIGNILKEKMKKIKCDAWVISYITEFNKIYHVEVDIFEKHR